MVIQYCHQIISLMLLIARALCRVWIIAESRHRQPSLCQMHPYPSLPCFFLIIVIVFTIITFIIVSTMIIFINIIINITIITVNIFITINAIVNINIVFVVIIAIINIVITIINIVNIVIINIQVANATNAVANVDDYSGSARLLAATTLRL